LYDQEICSKAKLDIKIELKRAIIYVSRY